MELTPSIGRIVHYKSHTGKVHAAIITNVLDSAYVNLGVFSDKYELKTSIRQGDEPNQWQWPVIH